MIRVGILESSDIVKPSDWCRPLQLVSMSGGMGDGYSFKSCYSGLPENNVKWVQVDRQFGECWFDKKVLDFFDAGMKYEFLRGDLPSANQLIMDDYTDLRMFK